MIIQSPLNYTGGKFRLLTQILPLFPIKIHRFFDFFCGGCNVSINIDSKQNICVDNDRHLIYLYQTFKNVSKESIFSWIYEIIEEYGLSLVSRDGYEHYGCVSSDGLGEYNREAFNRLRNDFNKKSVIDYRYYVMLYVIIIYAFNNQIRFNSNGDFNLPVGKRDFNLRIQGKLSAFIDRIQTGDFKFICRDFRDFSASSFEAGDFIYADPPYLITRAAYNENGGWNDRDEEDLLGFLDSLTEHNIRFALSNVLRSNGRENGILKEWLRENTERYEAIPLSISYANSNYHKRDKSSSSDEVLIVNYGAEERRGGQSALSI